MFHFILSPEQTNLIGAALSKMPYEAVADLMNNLRFQVDQQTKEQPEAAKQEEVAETPETNQE
jgi:hypothetical protein